MNPGQIVAGLNPVDLVGIEEKNPAVHLDANPVFRRIELSDVLEKSVQLRRDTWLRRLSEPLFCTVEGLMKANVIDGFEQIIERAELERRDRVVVECRDEDHRRHLVCADFSYHIEAVQLRHLHVQKYKVRLFCLKCRTPS